MLKNRTFPDNWSDLSIDQAQMNIIYLLRNYKRYKITVQDDGTVRIGNITIEYKKAQQILRYKFDVYVINGRSFTSDSENGKALATLCDLCKSHARPFKQKVSEWWLANRYPIFWTAIVFVVINVAQSYQDSKNRKEKIIREKIDEWKKQHNNVLDYGEALRLYEDSLRENIPLWRNGQHEKH